MQILKNQQYKFIMKQFQPYKRLNNCAISTEYLEKNDCSCQEGMIKYMRHYSMSRKYDCHYKRVIKKLAYFIVLCCLLFYYHLFMYMSFRVCNSILCLCI